MGLSIGLLALGAANGRTEVAAFVSHHSLDVFLPSLLQAPAVQFLTPATYSRTNQKVSLHLLDMSNNI